MTAINRCALTYEVLLELTSTEHHRWRDWLIEHQQGRFGGQCYRDLEQSQFAAGEKMRWRIHAAAEPERRPQPKPRPFPLPGATMQPPKPEGAQ